MVLGLALAVAAPAAFSMIAYEITKNPALRPLARTENDEAIYKGEIVATRILAKIRWSTKRQKGFSKQDLETAITKAFKTHGVRVYVSFEDVANSENVTVTYQVGVNTLGPTPIKNAADSVRGAIAAYRMYKMAAP